jgi:para-nitrobenzyl esterase
MNGNSETSQGGGARKVGTSRRALFQSALMAAGVAQGQGRSLPKQTGTGPAPAARRAPATTPSQPIVETAAGKVRGYSVNGTYAFKGIPFGAPTGGALRFQRPAKPVPWSGIRSCLHYGHICPNGNYWSDPQDNAPHSDEDAYLLYRTYWTPAGEDCLRLNVWTPGLAASTRKRPVMVYMHGGGFSGGSGHDLLAYDGENLARRNDVVVVTHNHRLNVFGYLNLAEIGGERFASSGNVGMLDLVAALEWVRDNISNFGGDPGNVTIFGQSGGGGKVSALMAMPEAKGLFQRAVIQSWPFSRFPLPPESGSLAAAVLAELNLGKSQVAQICDVPIGRLIDASQAALRRGASPAGDGRWIGWGPTVDGKVLPTDPVDPAAPPISPQVPLLVGTDLNEFVSGVDNPEVETLTEVQLADRARQRWGTAGKDIVEAYRREYSKATPFQLWAAISAASIRQSTITHVERRAALGAAPAYQYIFSWPTPVLEGRPSTFHACEIAFVFDNIDRCVRQTGGAPAALALSTQVSRAWTNFARHGSPDHAGLPHWPAYEAVRRSTMFFDSPCFVKSDPEGAGLRLIRQASVAALGPRVTP